MIIILAGLTFLVAWGTLKLAMTTILIFMGVKRVSEEELNEHRKVR